MSYSKRVTLCSILLPVERLIMLQQLKKGHGDNNSSCGNNVYPPIHALFPACQYSGAQKHFPLRRPLRTKNQTFNLLA